MKSVDDSRTVKVTAQSVYNALHWCCLAIKRQRADGTSYDAVRDVQQIAAMLGCVVDEDGDPVDVTIVQGPARPPLLIVE